jgi:uncharacterized protein (UPF0332 family)
MKESTQRLLAKAARAINAAGRLLDGGDADFAAGRAYYAMLYVAQALLNERGLKFRKHGGVHSAMGEHFVKTGLLDVKYHRWLLAAFGRRIAGDYDTEAVITVDEVHEMLVHAGEFLEVGGKLLSRTL